MSIKIVDEEVKSINVGNSPVRIVGHNGTAIWNNFNESDFVVKKTGKGNVTVDTWTWLANNVNGFVLNTNTKDSGWGDVGVTIWVRIYFAYNLFYDFYHHCYDSGFWGVVNTDAYVKDKDGNQIWDGGTSVANLGTRVKLINANTDWRFGNDENFQLYWDTYDMNGRIKTQFNKMSYFQNGYPRLSYAVTGNTKGENVEYTIKTISFK